MDVKETTEKGQPLGKLIAGLLLIALALSPFYLWQSGLPQVHHIIAAAAMGIYLLARQRIRWRSWWIFGLGFALYTIIVNLIVFALHKDIHTLLTSSYYIFNFLIFVLLVNAAQEVGRPLLSKVFWIHIVLLTIMAVLGLFDAGRYYGEGRMMGFFNDPNQMGNWSLWTAIIVGAIGRAIYRSWLPGMLAAGLAMLAIIFTVSRSAMLGFLVLLGVYALMGLYYLLFVLSLKVRIGLVRAMVLLAVIIAAIISFPIVLADNQQERLLTQVKIVTTCFQGKDLDYILEERGYDRLWKFSEYLVLGAGKGANQRYSERTWFLGEIHSSWAGLLFNYGIVGSVLFLGFIYHLLRRIRLVWFKLMLLAPFVYGFGTYGLRNWYFWIGLAMVYASWEFIRVQRLYSSKSIGS